MKKWIWAICTLLSACQASISTVSTTNSVGFGTTASVKKSVPVSAIVPQLNIAEGAQLLYLPAPELDFLPTLQENPIMLSIGATREQLNTLQFRFSNAEKPIEAIVLYSDGRFKTSQNYNCVLFDLGFLQNENNDYFKILNTALNLLSDEGRLIVAGEKTDNWQRDYVEAVENLAGVTAPGGGKIFKKIAVEDKFSATHFSIIILK